MSKHARGPLTRTLLAATAIGIAALASPAIAQQPGSGRPAEVRMNPPTPKKADNPPLLWSYFVLIILLTAVMVATMIPSKRGHQD
jgi:hypothetical protein